MKNRTITTVLVAASAWLALAEAASAYYSPRLGRFLNRDPINEPGAVLIRQAARPAMGFIPRDPEPVVAGPVRADAPKPVALRQLADLSDLGPNGTMIMGMVVAMAERARAPQDADRSESDLEEMNLYTYAHSSPTVYIDPLGLSTRCGPLTMKCKCKNKDWTVYGDSERAKFILGGKDGCVTLLVPKGIFCTGSCKDVKDWRSAGDPSVKILEHEACHACAHEDPWDSYFLSWIPGDLTGHCDRHKISVTPGW
jgi:hypothetical protein